MTSTKCSSNEKATTSSPSFYCITKATCGLLVVLSILAHEVTFRGGSFLLRDSLFEAKKETTTKSSLRSSGLVDESVSPTVKTKQRVYLLPTKFDGAEGELRQIYQDGIDRSERLELTDDVDELGAVWVVDELRMSCDEITPLATQSMDRRRNQTSLPDDQLVFKIFLLDIADWNNIRWFRCMESLSKVVGKQNVHFAVRQHVTGRSIVINETDPDSKPFTEFGEVVNYEEAKKNGYNMVKVLRYAVRSDLAESINRVLIEIGENRTRTTTGSEEAQQNASMALSKRATDSGMPDRVLIDRAGDVVHFFPPEWVKDDMSSLRCAVSRAIQALGKEANLTVFTDFSSFGAGGESGRSEIHDSYAIGLLHYKIVVVAQRDFHEGHFRLMEALIGGALVMTDPMHPLPYQLEDGKSLVVYNSLEDMKAKVRYYLDHKEERLAIAKRGYEVASTYHRTWHFMERLIFGDWSQF